MNAIESAVSSVASAIIPSGDMFQNIMPTNLEPFTIDLTLPTFNTATKAC